MTGVRPTSRWQDVCFLAMLAACPPLSIDMYLPAIQTIAREMDHPLSTVNLSLVLWFVGFSIALLVSGPLSDRYGRKPVLYGGLGLFTIASLGCAASTNIVMLISTRILQGIGAGGPSAMCLAICRDRYEGDRRKKVLATVSILLTLAPMLSPAIGTQLLIYFQWQAIFILQAFFGIGLLILTVGQTESAIQLSDTPLYKTFGRYGNLLKNRNYVRSTIALGTLIGPYLGYVAFAPIVYTRIFDQNNQTFSLLFALNALLYMTGALMSTRISKRMGDHALLTLCIISTLAGGLGITLIGHLHPATFALTMGLITLSFGMTRPISQHIILEQVQIDVGAASSMLVFYQFMIGAACMTIAGQPWLAPIVVFGCMAMAISIIVLMMWLMLHKKLASTDNEPPTLQEVIQE
ncbi:MAG TPA: multidrug transporter [Phycisphaerales bacterium]|nr:multidrug transporter [Phycisphaerales bacterium]HCD32680.1 multidrug transporter [Phycisphaerales bacterium]|tara:strand:+ start:384 stop:1604 length:1221 start_codon:yes stop_codon:yes gene_type:complete